MAREVWGTFAVSDHCSARAFVADVMLYDRLVLPVPPKNDEVEWERWTAKGWDPKRQQVLIEILRAHDRVQLVEWDAAIRELWAQRMAAAGDVAEKTAGYAFQASRTTLTANLPPGITGVESVTSYPSLKEIEKDLAIRKEDKLVLPAAAVTAVLGREFIVPDDPRMSDEQLLEESLNLSSKTSFKRKRAQFWRWQREFLGTEVITDEKAITSAIEEMQDLLEEEKTSLQKERIRTVSRYAFLIGSVTLGMFTAGMAGVDLAPMARVAGGAFLSIGQFTAERLLTPEDRTSRGAAMFHDVQRHFGWN